jgi:hypothetical protein
MRSAKSKRGASSPRSHRASVPGPSRQHEIARQCDTLSPKIVARTVASLSQVVSLACRKFSRLAGDPVDEAIRGSFRHNELLLDERSQVALQGTAVDARATGFEILHPELGSVGRQFKGHSLARGEFVRVRQDV